MSDNHGILAHHFDTLDQQRAAQTAGMWAFLATEILVFGVLFVSYGSYRAFYPDAFEAASRRLNALIGGVNTLVLLTSSLTMALAIHATEQGNRRKQLTCLILTAALGTLFLAFKVLEYYLDYEENLVPVLAFDPKEWTEQGIDPQHVQLFLMFYYIMTGVHAIHMIIGIGVLSVVILLAWLGRFPPVNYVPVELMGLYWHFVDLVWIFLLPLLYLVGTRTSFW